MDRKSELEKCFVEFANEQILDTVHRIKETFNKITEEQTTSFLWEEEKLFRKVLEGQKEGKIGQIKMLMFSFLRSSILLDHLELRIDIVDDQVKVGQKEILHAYHTLDFMESFFKENVKELNRYLESKIIRVKYHEKEYCKSKLIGFYQMLIQDYVKQMSCLLPYLEGYVKADVADDFKVVYGEFLAQGVICFEHKEGEEL